MTAPLPALYPGTCLVDLNLKAQCLSTAGKALPALALPFPSVGPSALITFATWKAFGSPLTLGHFGLYTFPPTLPSDLHARPMQVVESSG